MFDNVWMKRFDHLPRKARESLSKHSLLKVISGLDNFDHVSVARIAKAAALGGADLLDVACAPELVKLALDSSGLPICVSAVEPDLFPKAIEAGASMIEIGNFDSFYPKGRFFDAREVISLAMKSRKLLPEIPLSVTIPHILPLDQQAQLALELVDVGVDLIQTEGGTSAQPLSAGALGLIQKAAPTLAAVHSISEAFSRNGSGVPLLCASGLSSVTIPMALAAGAAGVGVGSAINKLDDDLGMIAAVRSLREASQNYRNSDISSMYPYGKIKKD